MRSSALLAIALCLLALTWVEGRTDPATGKCRVLYVGQWPYVGRPQYLVEDPLLETSVIPYHDFGAQLDQIRRYMHLRYPRSYGHLVKNYDLVFFSNIQHLAFTPAQLKMVSDGVVKEGIGFIMTGGHTSFGGTENWYPTWRTTSVYSILPVDPIDGIYLRPVVFKLLVTDPGHELMKSLPWDKIPLFTYTLNEATVKQGSHELARTDLKEGWPVLAYGDIGEGRSIAFMTPINVVDNKNLKDWGFFDDMCANMVYCGCRIKLPEDPIRIHELRRMFRSYYDQRLLYLSVVDFADKFGANTQSLEKKLKQIDSIKAESYRAYIEQDFESSSRLMKQAIDELREGQGDAVRLKRRAMLWIYIVEWLVVTATLMVTGSILWAVMVRRRLYRETATTRWNSR